MEPENGSDTSSQKETEYYIIDLQKTVKKIDEAYEFMKEVGASGKPVLFVGTKEAGAGCDRR